MPTCRFIVPFVALACLLVLPTFAEPDAARGKVLVYTKNGKGFVHDNRAASVEAIKQIGAENGFAVDASEDAAVMTDANLKQYKCLILSNTNNETFDTEEQKAAFQRYVNAGGGVVGIHSACGSERQWPWFWAMLGGRFFRHPKLQPFTLIVIDREHPSTCFLGPKWEWEDEFYFIDHLNDDLHVLLAGDLTTIHDVGKDKYPGDKFGTTFPLCWCHEFEGGRVWFTALGHKKEHYADATFRKHLLGGIQWVSGERKSPAPATLNTYFKELGARP